ncbi:hypothetical protein SAMN04515671_0158 [Nakamurella panacisegetis]|uniref:Bacteriocin biosynthesis cyclodehydratase domain-containing protein n=1 Tax=Nakamurella panacisegetis TaxID=1090615 RepID=A0A1H0HPL2_9ACTN|nr:hypothetical protein [Nakamurella panacisegetis]SDO21112.1 hypothetical protein SAMN04515671_0158 [Nakamurella panacisegetis]
MSVPTSRAIDLTGVYTMISGLPVLHRDPDSVQIGSEPPHCLVLHHAPPEAASILRRLNGTAPVGAVLRDHDADPVPWREVLSQLLDAHLLVPAHQWRFSGVTAGAFLEPERDSLVHPFGIPAARRALQARQDAIVVVRGTGRVATAVATSLAAAGVGHVHQQPDRALRLADLADLAAGTATTGPRDGRIGSPTAGDTAILAANLRRSAPGVRVNAPAPHHRLTLVVLAGDGPPSPSLAAELTASRLPHLAVTAGLTTAAVGPFVLPGRSSCLACVLRRRSEIDHFRGTLEEELRHEIRVPAIQLAAAAASIAAADALSHIDGTTKPATLDGTIEWMLGDLAPRRRSWEVHPDCGCSA